MIKKREITGGIGSKLFDVANYAFMFILTILFLYPIWDVLILSLSSPLSARLMQLRIIPDGFNLDSYKAVFEDQIIFIGYYNTIIRTFFGVIYSIFFTTLAAYSLTKKDLPFRTPIMLYILFTMFFSGGLIPYYLVVRSLGLIDTRLVLILPLMTSAWSLIIARNFLSTIPVELEESAYMDGAHPFTILIKIIFPLSMPILAVLALWTGVGHWNAWFDSMIFTRSRGLIVLQLLLRRIVIERQAAMLDDTRYLLETTASTTPATVESAVIIITIGPIVLAYPFLQKYFVKGILVGSLKG